MRRFNRFLASLVFTVLLLLFFYYSSALFWRVAYPEAYVGNFEGGGIPSQKTAAASRQLRGWSLFEDTAEPAFAKPVVPSKIDAVLTGVLAAGSDSDDYEKGIAFITLKGKRQKLFRVGDEVSPAVYLKRVKRDHVVLQRDDKEELLELKKAGLIGNQIKKVESPAAGSGSSSLGGKLRDIVEDDASRLINSFTFKRVDGQDTGFSIQAKNRMGRDILKRFGLKEKDVLLSANGDDLHAVMSDPKKLQSLLESDEVKVKFRRKGEIKVISLK